MADEQQAGIGETSSNGDGTAAAGGQSESQPGPSEERTRQMQELTHAYERARDELNDAIRNVRAELARIDFNQARTRARSWVDENPTLAVFLGIGAGILTGKLLSGAFHSEPPPLSVRARKRAELLAKEGGDYAGELSTLIASQVARAVHDASDAGAAAARRSGKAVERFGHDARSFGDDFSKRAEKAGKQFSKRAERAGKDISKRAERVGRDVSKHAEYMSRDISDRARGFGDSVTRRAEDVGEALSESTIRSFRELEDAAHDLSKTMKKRSKHTQKAVRKKVDQGADFSGTVLNAARTAVAAVVIKKVNDWVKAMR